MKELGENLKAERLKQGLTLEALSEQTRISLQVLRTLEDGDLDQIGTPLLIRSFVRNYCAALHIDPEPLLEDHQTEILAYNQQQKGIESYRRWAASRGRRRGKGLLVTLFLAIAIGAAVFIAVHVTRKKAQVPGAQFVARDINPQEEIPADLSPSAGSALKRTSPVTKVPIPKPAAPATPAKPPVVAKAQPQSPQPAAGNVPATKPATAAAPETPAATTTPATPSVPNTVVGAQQSVPAPPMQGHQLKVEAVQKVWIQVKIDNKKTSSVLLEPGDKRQWDAQNGVRILLGNAGGVQMQWDGQPLRSLGRSGQVVRLTLPNPKYLQSNASPH